MPRHPKPADQKVTRHKLTLRQVMLPEAREGDPPQLPGWREWRPETLAWWRELWRRPQATQWDQTGMSLWVLAVLYDDVFGGRVSAWRFEEIRAHEDRHGLSPRAMLALRWSFGPAAEPDEARTIRSGSSSSERRKQLRVV